MPHKKLAKSNQDKKGGKNSPEKIQKSKRDEKKQTNEKEENPIEQSIEEKQEQIEAENEGYTLYEALHQQRMNHREAFGMLVADNAKLESRARATERELEKVTEEYQTEKEKNRELVEELKELREKHSNYVIANSTNASVKKPGDGTRAMGGEDEEEKKETEDDPVRVKDLQIRLLRLTKDFEEKDDQIQELKRMLYKQKTFIEFVESETGEDKWGELKKKYERRNKKDSDDSAPQSAVCVVM